MILRAPASYEMIMSTGYVTIVIQGKNRVTMGILMDEPQQGAIEGQKTHRNLVDGVIPPPRG